MLPILFTLTTAAPQANYGKEQPRTVGPASYACPEGFALDGKKCFQEYYEPVVKSCPAGFVNAGGKDMNCVQEADKVGACPPGSINSGKQCSVTESVPAIPFCPPGYYQNGKGCTQTVQLPVVQKCDVGKLIGKQCLLEDRAQILSETYCPAGYIQTSKGCQKTVTYDCTRPRQSKNGGYGTAVGAVHGKPYETTHYGNTYGGGYYSNHKKHLRMLGEKKHDTHEIIDYGKDLLPPPSIEVISKQCERIEYAKPETRAFCPPGYDQSGKGCVRLITSEPRSVCSNGGSAKECSTEKFAALQHQCPNGYSMNGKNCSTTKAVPLNFACPIGFVETGKACQKTAATLANCPPGLLMRGNQCVGKRFAEPIVTQQVTCIGKGCNESH